MKRCITLSDWASHAMSPCISRLQTLLLATEILDHTAIRSCMTAAQGTLERGQPAGPVWVMLPAHASGYKLCRACMS